MCWWGILIWAPVLDVVSETHCTSCSGTRVDVFNHRPLNPSELFVNCAVWVFVFEVDPETSRGYRPLHIYSYIIEIWKPISRTFSILAALTIQDYFGTNINALLIQASLIPMHVIHHHWSCHVVVGIGTEQKGSCGIFVCHPPAALL